MEGILEISSLVRSPNPNFREFGAPYYCRIEHEYEKLKKKIKRNKEGNSSPPSLPPSFAVFGGGILQLNTEN